MTIGSETGNDLVVPVHGVSRAHARVVREGPGVFVLEDVGSRGGTTVNGHPAARVLLSHGDEVVLGSWRAIVRLD